ncbi:hypothetical protein DRJ17_03030 [Candidatus Woesearchaeota archaeon]|nr:MAG: hypothetical protein DRJ17_03030 [Candidatus Woesearchaeota archaeon]
MVKIKTKAMIVLLILLTIAVLLLTGCVKLQNFGSCSAGDKDCQQPFLMSFSVCHPAQLQINKVSNLYDLSMIVKSKGLKRDACKVELIIIDLDLHKFDAAVKAEITKNPEIKEQIEQNAAAAKEKLEDIMNNKISCKIPLTELQQINDIEQLNFYSHYCKGELITAQ